VNLLHVLLVTCLPVLNLHRCLHDASCDLFCLTYAVENLKKCEVLGLLDANRCVCHDARNVLVCKPVVSVTQYRTLALVRSDGSEYLLQGAQCGDMDVPEWVN